MNPRNEPIWHQAYALYSTTLRNPTPATTVYQSLSSKTTSLAKSTLNFGRYTLDYAADLLARNTTTTALDLDPNLPTGPVNGCSLWAKNQSLENQNPEEKERTGKQSFPQFSLLPTELRTLIWYHFAHSTPRVLEIRRSTSPTLPSCISSVPFTISPPPSILHVCQESRLVGLKAYTLSLGIKNDLLCGQKGIYVNFEQDVLYFGMKCDFWAFLRSCRIGIMGGLEGVQRLAVSWETFRRFGESVNMLERFEEIFLKHFVNLKEVIVVGQDGRGRRFDLGKSPTMVLGEVGSGFEVAGWEMADESEMWWALDFVKKATKEKEEKSEGWKGPGVRFGTFVKGRGDIWYRSGDGPVCPF